jgi:transposase
VYFECVSVDDGLCGHFCLCPQRGIVDTSDQTLQVRVAGAKKRRRTIRERREIVEETLLPGASVSRVARRHDVNANQVFYWRKLYREGQLGSSTDRQLVAVKVANDRSVEAVKEDDFLPRSGTLEIKLSKGTVRIFGTVDVMALRAVIECLVG